MRARLPCPEPEAQNRNGASRPTPKDSRALQLRIPGELHSWATTVAAHLNQSLSEFVLQVVQKEVDRQILRGGSAFISRVEERRNGSENRALQSRFP